MTNPKMKLKANKKYKIFVPYLMDKHKTTTVHIDYILDNPLDQTNRQDYKLVVYRVWLKHKGYFKFCICEYYVFCMYNNWEYYV